MLEIRTITDQKDLNLKNEPFSMPGRMIPELKNGIWSYHIEQFPHPETMVFPDENYTLATLRENHLLLGAYENGRCVGVAIYQLPLFRYLYLYDLKVSAQYRGRGIGKALIRAGLEAARERGLSGIYTIAQDNNVNACLFYLKAGFEIGGFDNRVYQGTSQEGKADIIFYTRQEVLS